MRWQYCHLHQNGHTVEMVEGRTDGDNLESMLDFRDIEAAVAKFTQDGWEIVSWDPVVRKAIMKRLQT